MTAIALEYAKRLTNKHPHAVREDQEEEFLRQEMKRNVQAALHGTGFHELRRVDVLGEEGHVTLDGTVSRYYLKQVAQTVAHKLEGVRSVTNRIRVLQRNRVEATG